MRSHPRGTNLIRIFGVTQASANLINAIESLVTWPVNTQGIGTLVGTADLASTKEVKSVHLTLRNRLS